MSTRETLVARLHAVIDAAVIAAYPHLTTGCTRDVPELDEIQAKSTVPPERTPLVYLHDGDEHYASSENGTTEVHLAVRLAAVVKRRDGLEGPLGPPRNVLLALIQKTAWNWRPSDGLGGAHVVSGGDSEVTTGPEEAWCAVPVVLCYFMRDDNP